MLYFITLRNGNWDNWQAPVLPVVDFNADGIVDLVDLEILIDNWGANKTLCDIGPMPWGDGKVDAEDLKVFMEHWGQEIHDPALVAQWKLDETEGITASDSVGSNHGTLVGNPTWQPADGKVKGALLLDGTDDAISAPYILNPGKTPFSVFVWVKSGAPGQIILSQAKGANWLRAAPTSGTLQTELNEPGRNAAKHLQSPTVITDGAWHHVGSVWDGTDRVLYVDKVEVARGTLTGLPDSISGLYIGAGSTLAPGTFWSGLIDDVRVYDRAVKP